MIPISSALELVQRYKTPALLIATLLVSIFTAKHVISRSEARFEARAVEAEATGSAALALVESMTAQRDSATARAERSAARIVARTPRREAAARAVATTPTAEQPDTCRPALEARDSALQIAQDDLKDAEETAGALREGLAVANRSVALLRPALKQEIEVLHDRPKPGRTFLQKITPEVGAGAFAGVCSTGKPCAGVGVTLAWRLW